MSSGNSRNLSFDGLLLSKAYKYLDEKVKKSCVSWHWRVMQSLKKNWLLVPKMTRGICWILMRAVTSLKICTLTCFFCQQHKKFQLNKYRRIISHDTKKTSKLWRKTYFSFEKWYGEIVETLTRTVESLKVCTLMSYFCRKYVIFELKKYRRVVSWKMTYGFKNDITNLVNFHTNSWK